MLLRGLFTLAVMFAANAAFAGHESHGGDGVYIKLLDKMFLLDLVEAGVEDEPIFDRNIAVDPDIAKRVDILFRGASEAPTDLIAIKLSEIASVDSLLAATLLKTMELHQWRLVRADLVNVPDEDSVLKFGDHELVQLAIRRLQTISIAREHWNRLSAEHKAALIFHESVYALIRPTVAKSGHGNLLQDPVKVREIIGHLFSYSLLDRGGEGLRVLLLGGKPGVEFLTADVGMFNGYLPLGGPGQAAKIGNVFGAPRMILVLYPSNGSSGGGKYAGHYFDLLETSAAEIIEILCPNRRLGDRSIALAAISPATVVTFSETSNTYVTWNTQFELDKSFFSSKDEMVLGATEIKVLDKTCEVEVGALLDRWLAGQR